MNKSLLCSAVLVCLLALSGNAQIITTCIGNNALHGAYSGNGGPATAAGLNLTYSTLTDTAGNIYVGTGASIRKVDPFGIVSTLCGTNIVGNSGDGGPATAALISAPVALALDKSGNFYFADQVNQVVRKINTSGIISTIAGTGSGGFSGDGGPATDAKLWMPCGVAVDTAGNIYIGDAMNSCVRKVDNAGNISTFAGLGTIYGYSGDGGPASASRLCWPSSIVIDNHGNIFIADQSNNVIRKINTAGNISTVAGNGFEHGLGSGHGGYTGDGGPATDAEMNGPSSVAVDTSGNIYITDSYNNLIRKVNTAGMISTYAGDTAHGYTGDGGPATAAEFNGCWGVAVNRGGDLYMADETNYVVRRILTGGNHLSFIPPGIVATCKNTEVSIGAYLPANDLQAGLTETWSVVTAPGHGALGGFPAIAASTGWAILPTGVTYTPTMGYVGADNFTVKVSDGPYSATTTVHVVVQSFPVAGAVTGKDTVCIGSSLALSATVAGGSWNCSNGNATIAGGNIHGVTSGMDTVFYIVTNSCGSDTARLALHILPAGECPSVVYPVPPVFTGIKVYPNPSSGTFTISLPDDARSITITDLLGRYLATKEIDRNSVNVINVNFDLPPGNYFLKVNTSEKTYREKITIW